ncbi:unnamed protein product [Dibothriocephalus latus]|uniref:A-kinase anchor protein 7-like phosphoesterase domain-containing protein n=1 Tax=Dibothriocephalus latus TaxID=60516 RepID=A0A3P7P4C7_DIBLA|nr:unnamed protein product [Dibothriocephalus latus]
MRSQKVTDILRLLLTDERIPDNLITVVYTDLGTGSEAKKPLTDFHYDPVLGLNISTLGLRDYQITCIKLLDKVVWDKISGVDLISTSSPPPIYALLESTSQGASLGTVDKLPVASSKAPEHLRRLCAIQASKPGFRKHRFFICQRVYNEVMIEKAVNIQTKICEKVPLLKESCYPPGWLHVTLATVCPTGPEELHLAIRLLQRMIDKYYYESHPHMIFRYPLQFADFVIVFHASISDSINEVICSAFRGDGIEIDDHEFNPHLTVIKPPSNVARKLSGRLNVAQYHNRYNAGSTYQAIDRLDVCMCGQERDEEGFWLRAASLPLAPDEKF